MEGFSDDERAKLDPPQDFRTLMRRVQEGSDGAARELVERYGSHILRVVRRRLNIRLRSKFDSNDFVQAVWASFFAMSPRQSTFQDPQALVLFLVNVAQNKVIDVVRQRLQAAQYDVKRERSLEDADIGRTDRLVARQPTPLEIAIAKEEWEQFLEGQPPHYRQILVCLLEGKKPREVALELGLNERMVYRVMDLLEPKTVP